MKSSTLSKILKRIISISIYSSLNPRWATNWATGSLVATPRPPLLIKGLHQVQPLAGLHRRHHLNQRGQAWVAPRRRQLRAHNTTKRSKRVCIQAVKVMEAIKLKTVTTKNRPSRFQPLWNLWLPFQCRIVTSWACPGSTLQLVLVGVAGRARLPRPAVPVSTSQMIAVIQ